MSDENNFENEKHSLLQKHCVITMNQENKVICSSHELELFLIIEQQLFTKDSASCVGRMHMKPPQ